MELYLPPKRPERNKKGQFVKGLVPHNKGKNAKEYVSPESLVRMLSTLKKGNGGNNKKPVIAMDDTGEVVGWFESTVDAARKMGVTSASIRASIYGLCKHCKGFVWKYEEDL